MKVLVFFCFLSISACGNVLPRHGRVLQLIKDANTIQELHDRTAELITKTQEEMKRMSSGTRSNLDDLSNSLQTNLDSIYVYSKNRTNAVVNYLLDEIDQMKGVVDNLETCTSLVPYLSSLAENFDDQLKMTFETARYTANTTLENKYTDLLNKIITVGKLSSSLESCKLDEDCMVGVADEVVEYNLELLDGLDDIDVSIPNVLNETLTSVTTSANSTVYIDEDYVCNVGKIIENCIEARKDVPILSTTDEPPTTTPLPSTASDSTDTSSPSTPPPSPKKYCTHETFSP